MFRHIMRRITGKALKSLYTTAITGGFEKRFTACGGLLDPSHTHHCKIAKRLAANSPLPHTPGVTRRQPTCQPAQPDQWEMGASHCHS